MRLLTLCLAGLLVGAPASGQHTANTGPGLNALLGIGSVKSELGLLVGVGASVETRWAILRLLFDLHLRGPEDSDYAWNPTTGGPECREKDTGRIVQDSWCDVARATVGLGADVSFKIPAAPGAVYLGGGYRAGEGSTPYVTAGYGFHPLSSNWHLLVRALAGEGLLQLQGVASLPVGVGRR